MWAAKVRLCGPGKRSACTEKRRITHSTSTTRIHTETEKQSHRGKARITRKRSPTHPPRSATLSSPSPPPDAPHLGAPARWGDPPLAQRSPAARGSKAPLQLGTRPRLRRSRGPLSRCRPRGVTSPARPPPPHAKLALAYLSASVALLRAMCHADVRPLKRGGNDDRGLCEEDGSAG